MGKMQRNKGAGGEREAIRVLGEQLGASVETELKRNLQQTRDGGQDLIGLGPWAIEVKRSKIKRMAPWWTQAVEQAGNGYPAVMYRLDFSREWKVCVHISDLSPYCFADWPKFDISGIVELSVQAFAALFRERMPAAKPEAWTLAETDEEAERRAAAARGVC